MINLKLNVNGDIYAENGTFALVSNVDEVVQHLTTRLKMYLAEWFLDESSGVPYFQSIIQKPFDALETESVIKDQILNTNNVLEIIDFNLQFNNTTRALNINFSCTTTYGLIENQQLEFNI